MLLSFPLAISFPPWNELAVAGFPWEIKTEAFAGKAAKSTLAVRDAESVNKVLDFMFGGTFLPGGIAEYGKGGGIAL
jgi:hypothetical protein